MEVNEYEVTLTIVVNATSEADAEEEARLWLAENEPDFVVRRLG